MRVRRLWINDYLLLRDLDLRFDRPGRLDTGSYALDFLVGVNGSGKTTVLRALALIISDLRADRTTDFSYALEYELQGRDGPYQVSVEQRPDRTRHMTVKPMSPEAPALFDDDAIDQGYLPDHLVVHTTGSEAEWDRLLQRTAAHGEAESADKQTLADPVQRAVKELPGHLPASRGPAEETETEPSYLLVRASRLPLVTLCGLLAHLASTSKPLSAVLESAGLKHVRGFSLRFRLHAALSDFTAFNSLKRYALRHIRQGNDHLLVFDLSEGGDSPAKRLLDDPDIGGSLALFRKLDRLMAASATGEPTIQQINVFFERDIHTPAEDEGANDVTRLLLLDWLSDGEQSFLGRMAMLAMLDAEDSLILLDEPEVHFNDYWKRQVVELLDVMMQAHTNHLLITTHSSILLSDVTEAHVTVLVRGSDGWARRQFLRLPLLAVDPSEIMVNWFGTERSVGERSTRLLSEAVDRGDPEELARLLELVGPGYWRYRIKDRLEELRAASS